MQFWFLSSEIDHDLTLDESYGSEIKSRLLKICGNEFYKKPSRIKIASGATVEGKFTIDDERNPSHFDINFRVNRLGIVASSSVVFNIGALFFQICDSLGIKYK